MSVVAYPKEPHWLWYETSRNNSNNFWRKTSKDFLTVALLVYKIEFTKLPEFLKLLHTDQTCPFNILVLLLNVQRKQRFGTVILLKFFKYGCVLETNDQKCSFAKVSSNKPKVCMTSCSWRCYYIRFWCLEQSTLLNIIGDRGKIVCGDIELKPSNLAEVKKTVSITSLISNKHLNKDVFTIVSLHQKRFSSCKSSLHVLNFVLSVSFASYRK